jgi:predicted dehydrogenase
VATPRLGFGVVGVNPRIRRAVLAGIAGSRRGRVAAVASRDLEKARAITSEVGGTPYSRIEDLLRDPAVDVVFVCTPHNLHGSMSLAALRAGKRVICEKPLASSIDEASEMAAVAKDLGIPSLVNFTYHSLPGHRYVAQLLGQGAIGRLCHLDLTYLQARQRLPNAKPGDVLLDVGAHQVDLACWWCGAGAGGAVSEVGGLQEAAGDTASIYAAIGRTDTGALVTLQANRVAAGWRNGMVCRLVGSDGMLTLTFDTDEFDVRLARFGDGSPEGKPRPLPTPADLAVSYADFPAFHIDRLVAALAGETWFPDFAYGFDCQRLLAAIRTSIDEHHWVQIAKG